MNDHVWTFALLLARVMLVVMPLVAIYVYIRDRSRRQDIRDRFERYEKGREEQ